MERHSEYDFRQHDRIWQRVSPGLTPFPALRQEMPGSEGVGRQLQLAGAQANPCCLGSEAMESLPVLEGFLEEERQVMALERALLRRVRGGESAAVLGRLVRGSELILRRVAAISFLIEGSWPQPAGTPAPPRVRQTAEGLRSAYHLEVCGAMNYERAAEGTVDVCLNRLLTQLSQEKYARADRVLKLLADYCC